MQAAEGIPVEIVLVVQSLIVLFIAAPPLVRTIFRLPAAGGRRAATSRPRAPMSTDRGPPPDAVGHAGQGRRHQRKLPVAFGVFTVALRSSLLARRTG